MQLPFTNQEFLEVFRIYNETVFPLQVVFNLAAFAAVSLLFKRIKKGDKVINSVLAFLWLWIGIVYHIIFFSEINKAAYFFGILFIIQSLIIFIYGVLSDKLVFGFNKDIFSYAGLFFILYALLIYPVLGYFFGHGYPYSPTFGLPCPTAIFTFGIFLFTQKKLPLPVIIIPFLWSLLGFSAAMQLSIYEDYGLSLAGLTALVFLFINKKKEIITG